MSTDEILFPRCGITYGDVMRVTERPISLTGAARRLGVSASQLERVAEARGFRSRFINRLDAPAQIAFPGKCITIEDLRTAARECPNGRAAAKKLKVSERQLYRVAKEHGITFQKRKPRDRCLTAEDVMQLAEEGYTQKDAAFVVDVSYEYFKELVGLYGLNDHFPSSGQAAAISRRGYTEPPFFDGGASHG